MIQDQAVIIVHVPVITADLWSFVHVRFHQ
jgi:hypothetical protein